MDPGAGPHQTKKQGAGEWGRARSGLPESSWKEKAQYGGDGMGQRRCWIGQRLFKEGWSRTPSRGRERKSSPHQSPFPHPHLSQTTPTPPNTPSHVVLVFTFVGCGPGHPSYKACLPLPTSPGSPFCSTTNTYPQTQLCLPPMPPITATPPEGLLQQVRPWVPPCLL